jgi:hypothetical protein
MSEKTSQNSSGLLEGSNKLQQVVSLLENLAVGHELVKAEIPAAPAAPARATEAKPVHYSGNVVELRPEQKRSWKAGTAQPHFKKAAGDTCYPDKNDPRFEDV